METVKETNKEITIGRHSHLIIEWCTGTFKTHYFPSLGSTYSILRLVLKVL